MSAIFFKGAMSAGRSRHEAAAPMVRTRPPVGHGQVRQYQNVDHGLVAQWDAVYA
jgi:hypothetical protein